MMFRFASYSAWVVSSKTIIYLGIGESNIYLYFYEW